MSNIFITGSSDGLGQLAAKKLIEMNCRVVLHARNEQRAEDTRKQVPDAEKVLIADLSSPDECRRLAKEVNALGKFDAIIHNAGVYQTSGDLIFRVNTIAPYILTCLIQAPKRLIYLSSGLHRNGRVNIKNLDSRSIGYSDSKAYLNMLAFAVARKWPRVCSNAVDPGWVPTKMGGAGATGDLQKGYETQVWLAADENCAHSGKYFYHKNEKAPLPATENEEAQDLFLEKCAEISGINF